MLLYEYMKHLFFRGISRLFFIYKLFHKDTYILNTKKYTKKLITEACELVA